MYPLYKKNYRTWKIKNSVLTQVQNKIFINQITSKYSELVYERLKIHINHMVMTGGVRGYYTHQYFLQILILKFVEEYQYNNN